MNTFKEIKCQNNKSKDNKYYLHEVTIQFFQELSYLFKEDKASKAVILRNSPTQTYTLSCKTTIYKWYRCQGRKVNSRR